MSIPIKHHYLPVFYLSRWSSQANDGRVWAYQRPHRSVTVRAYHPGAIGYQKHLYAIDGRSDPAARQELESGFMSPVDSLAAEALESIESTNYGPDDARLRSAWSRFILSLMFRNPERIEFLRTSLWPRTAEIASEYDALRAPDDPATLEEFQANLSTGPLDEAQAILLRKLIDSPFLGLHLNNMKWVTVEFQNQRHGLVTSDSPVISSNGFGVEDGFVILPISPARLFIAANTDRIIRSFVDQDPAKLERAMNVAVVNQAEALVIGHTQRHLRFVENHMGFDGCSIKQGTMQRASWRAPI